MFKQQSGQKPVGEEIKAHDFFDVPAGVLIVPGAGFVFIQKGAGEEFHGENTQGVDASPKIRGNIFKGLENRV